MTRGRIVKIHVIVAYTLVALVLLWGVLLSPPFRELRVALGFPAELPGSRFNGWAAEIIASDIEDASFYLARVSHYYHVVFAALLYASLVLSAGVLGDRIPLNTLTLALVGALMTAVGGIGYAYFARLFYLHGLFIAGLAFLFAAGVLVAQSLWKPRSEIEIGLFASVLLLLIGGVVGGYVGSSYMDDSLADAFVKAKIASRFDPDLGEHVEVWRAMTGHAHAMVTLVLTGSMLVGFAATGPRWARPRLAKLSLWAVTLSLAATAVGSYLVWPLGGIAHKIITPSSLVLLIASLLAAFALRAPPPMTADGALVHGLRVGLVSMWPLVVVPGAIVAVSLHKPVFFDPPMRDPSRDWAELAYSIGHWHILLAAWGVTLLITLLASIGRSRLAVLSAWLAVVGFLVASAGVNLYALTAPPGAYSPNPYDNLWVRLLIEPGLTIMALAAILGYVEALRWALNKQ
ncbi:hypothetical protein [Pyrolobus fumarii]|uniref:hypothetical protein n=1 Tax=Pyrolobus fumarii TaxID=54252 RepID=UPI0014328C6A|nr:hypothetical protein [Pyrolobus fumarii]